MKRWVPRIVLGLILFLVLLGAGFMGISSSRMARSWDVPVVSITTSDDSATLALGEHVARTRGCMDCHREDMTGRVVVDDPAFGRFTATNLTPGENGVGASYSDDDWVRAIRSGIRPDGRALLLMPSHEYRVLGPRDLGALVSWLKALPPRASEPVQQTVGPIGRVVHVLGQAPLVPAELIDHDDTAFDQPDEAVSVEFGAYVAAACVGCHQADFAGGPMLGSAPGSPDPANLTPDPETGLGSWTEEEFLTFLTTGVKPDGSQADRVYMPWPVTAAMTDVERRAMWAFFRSLPPVRSEQ